MKVTEIRVDGCKDLGDKVVREVGEGESFLV